MTRSLIDLTLTLSTILLLTSGAEAQFRKLPFSRPPGGEAHCPDMEPPPSSEIAPIPSADDGPSTGPRTDRPGPRPDPNGPASATATPSGVQVQPTVAIPSITGLGDSLDWTRWSIWWDMNKDAYLRLKEAIHHPAQYSGTDDFFLGDGDVQFDTLELRPSPEAVHGRVVPALVEALEGERNPELISTILVALGKIGVAPRRVADLDLAAVLSRYLGHPNREVTESAVTALGILGTDEAAFVLADLLSNGDRARALVLHGRVGARLQSYAAYALGLIGHRTEREDVRRFVAHNLLVALDRWNGGPRDLPVACVSALGILPMSEEAGHDASTDAFPTHCRASLIRELLAYFADGRRNYLVRAHVPTAVARLARGLADEELRAHVAAMLLEPIRTRSKERREVRQSCALALGLFGDADHDSIDRDVRETLEEAATRVGDSTVRHFALVALAQIASRPGAGDGEPLGAAPEITHLLMKRLGRGRSTARPWLEVSLGVLGRGLTNVRRSAPAEAGRDLGLALTEARSPVEAGAGCIGAGLHGDLRNAMAVTERLAGGTDATRGYAALGIGLMDAQAEEETLLELLRGSIHRPLLLEQVAIAMALLGHKRVVPALVEMLEEAGSTAERNSISLALSSCGDARSIDPLLELFEAENVTDLSRTFAALALGNVAEKDELPWRAVYARGVNYLAATTTMTGGQGILDIP